MSRVARSKLTILPFSIPLPSGMPDVFNYTDPVKFLRESYLYVKKSNYYFSQRYISACLGALNSRSAFFLILKNGRLLTPNVARKLACLFNLTSSRKKYFFLLCYLVRLPKFPGIKVSFSIKRKKSKPAALVTFQYKS